MGVVHGMAHGYRGCSIEGERAGCVGGNAVMRFTIQGRLPGYNEIIGATNAHRYAGHMLKRRETKRCGQEIIAQSVPTFKKPISILFQWFEPNARRDIDNVSAGQKFILDALVETGRLTNDTREWVTMITHEFPIDRKNPRIEVVVIEV